MKNGQNKKNKKRKLTEKNFHPRGNNKINKEINLTN